MRTEEPEPSAWGGTIVVVPSLTLSLEDLRNVTGVVFYEERLLCFLLLLAEPTARVVYTTSTAIDPAIIDYYLRFVPDPDDARRRLTLIDAGDPELGWLSAKLLSDPVVLDRLRDAIGDPSRARLLPFIATPVEHELAEALGVPVDGPRAELGVLGSKSGARRVAIRAGVGVLPGSEDLFTVDDVSTAVTDLLSNQPNMEAVVVKLNDCFSGLGNVILEVGGLADPLPTSKTVFCSPDETWPTYIAKLATQGGIVEALLRDPELRSPSAQLRISPAGVVEILSTHDQILGGPQNQIYLGCRFPAHPDYRLRIQSEALKIGEVLAGQGVVGSFGIDFLVVGKDVYLSEINLRLGGTTHPFWMARLATRTRYDLPSGELQSLDGEAVYYVATDNLKSTQLTGRTPAEVISLVDRSGLAYEKGSRTGIALHLLGATPSTGKLGATCIANSPGAADDLYRALFDLVGADAL
ncbi:MAG TPA: peptide ligase PGM1-related protein [Acidimicrobiia bacterium]|nr:peptide ligase PGM1-related protein [Acidimicrobiia bacterium]